MVESIGTPALWAGFIALVFVMLWVDLFLNRESHEVKPKEALAWTAVWVALAMAFAVFIGWRFGSEKAMEFVTGYVIEKALSVDNLFVFILVFSTFGVPAKYQHRILFYGIFGAVIMRVIFIFAGAALIAKFHWTIYLFGGFLLFTGIKILIGKGTEVHPEKNPLLRLFGKLIPTCHDFHNGHFFSRDGRWHASALLPVLVVIEATDVVFAVDSIPAIFGVTLDPYIVFTSNIFAILGLRSLFFLLAHAMDKFHHLKYGLGLVLSFIGVKMGGIDFFHVPIGWSLGVVLALLGGSMASSLVFPMKPKDDGTGDGGASKPGDKIERYCSHAISPTPKGAPTK